MNVDNGHTSGQISEVERRMRQVLEESVSRTDARVRSRLNQARHAALEAAVSSAGRSHNKTFWRLQTLMPATGAVAAALVFAIVLWGRPEHRLPLEGSQTAVEDIELIADDEALNLMEEGDRSFYEWAVSQDDASEGTST
jgi:hypothetical protein